MYIENVVHEEKSTESVDIVNVNVGTMILQSTYISARLEKVLF